MVPQPAYPPREDPLPPSLTWALSRILPGREETLLLRSILQRGPSATEAWKAFSSRIPDLTSLFRTDTGGRKRLSPLLLTSVRENDLDAAPGLMTVLRTAYLREQLRAKAYREISGEVYEALRVRGIRFLVLKGAALSETAYLEPCFRHSHDIDLLLPKEDLKEAEEALTDLGLGRRYSLPWDRGIVFRHASDLPILLLSTLYRLSFYQAEFETLWSGRRQVASEPLGPIQILAPADNLVHALGHASYCPSRSSLVWVTDAWMILHSDEVMDWELFEGRTRESRLEAPVFVLLRYLKQQIQAPIPVEALDGVGALAAGAGKLRRDVALYGARQARGKHPKLAGLIRPGWKERMTLLFWELFPSSEYISWAYEEPPRAFIPAIYLMRPFTYLAEVLKWRFLGLLKSSTTH